MRSSGRLRRTLAISACGGIASALAWIPAGSASASVSNTFYAAADGSSDYTGAGAFACSLTAGVDNPESTHAAFSSGRRTRSVNLNQTFTSTANSSDATTVSGRYKGSLSVSKHHGHLSRFKMAGDGHVTIRRALGNATQCATSAFLAVESYTTFTESKPGWLYVTRDTGNSSETVFDAQNVTTGASVLFEVYFGDSSKATARGFLAPGTYLIPEWAVALIAGPNGSILKSPGGGTVQRSSLASHMTGQFYGAGAAFGTARGRAGRFVRFPGSVSCSHHSAKLTWTGKAGRLAGGSFFVNGHKKASVSNPKAGHSVVLRHLGKSADNKITAKLSLAGGGKASATRAYVPCKG